MIILGWIIVILLMFVFHYAQIQNKNFVSNFGGWIICGFIVIIAMLLRPTLEELDKRKVNTPTILICNNVTVAESVNGFSYRDKSGTYEDYRGALTYTPRQGEVCKEYLKGE